METRTHVAQLNTFYVGQACEQPVLYLTYLWIKSASSKIAGMSFSSGISVKIKNQIIKMVKKTTKNVKS